jgi:hypothetical protein
MNGPGLLFEPDVALEIAVTRTKKTTTIAIIAVLLVFILGADVDVDVLSSSVVVFGAGFFFMK